MGEIVTLPTNISTQACADRCALFAALGCRGFSVHTEAGHPSVVFCTSYGGGSTETCTVDTQCYVAITEAPTPTPTVEPTSSGHPTSHSPTLAPSATPTSPPAPPTYSPPTAAPSVPPAYSPTASPSPPGSASTTPPATTAPTPSATVSLGTPVPSTTAPMATPRGPTVAPRSVGNPGNSSGNGGGGDSDGDGGVPMWLIAFAVLMVVLAVLAVVVTIRRGRRDEANDEAKATAGQRAEAHANPACWDETDDQDNAYETIGKKASKSNKARKACKGKPSAPADPDSGARPRPFQLLAFNGVSMPSDATPTPGDPNQPDSAATRQLLYDVADDGCAAHAPTLPPQRAPAQQRRPGAGDQTTYAVPLPVAEDEPVVLLAKPPSRLDSTREYMKRNSGYLSTPEPDEATYHDALPFGLSPTVSGGLSSTAVYTTPPPRSGEIVYISNSDYLMPTPLAGRTDLDPDGTDPDYEQPVPLKFDEPLYSKPHTKA